MNSFHVHCMLCVLLMSGSVHMLEITKQEPKASISLSNFRKVTFHRQANTSAPGYYATVQALDVHHCSVTCVADHNCMSFVYNNKCKEKINCFHYSNWVPENLITTPHHDFYVSPKLVLVNQGMYYEDAISYCAQNYAGALVSVLDSTTQSALEKIIDSKLNNKNSIKAVWIGLDCIIQTGQYVWSTGHKFDFDKSYNHWASEKPDGGTETQVTQQLEFKKWDDYAKQSDFQFPFVCQVGTLGNHLILPQDMVYGAAKKACSKIGNDWRLAIFLTKRSFELAVQELGLRKYNLNGWWIGLDSLDKVGEWKWNDGTPFNTDKSAQWTDAATPADKEKRCARIYVSKIPNFEVGNAKCDVKNKIYALCQRFK